MPKKSVKLDDWKKSKMSDSTSSTPPFAIDEADRESGPSTSSVSVQTDIPLRQSLPPGVASTSTLKTCRPKPIRKCHPPNPNYPASARFKYKCPKCDNMFATLKHQKSHTWACYFCEKCQKHVDYRHAKICGKRGERKGKRLLCNICHRLRAKDGFWKHMSTHGVKNWSRRAHPEVLSEDEYLANLEASQQLVAKNEKAKQQVEENAVKLAAMKEELARLELIAKEREPDAYN